MKSGQFLDLSPANLITQRKATEKNWSNFQGNPQSTLSIRSYIHDSWQRCVNFGVSPARNSTDISINQDELESLIQRSDMYEYAMPRLRYLSEQARGTGYVVTLCNQDGRIIFLDGDGDVLRSAEKMNFVLGADWSESAIGTNAIGTSLILKHPVQVFAAEHFCEGVHDWVCSSAPIYNPTTHDILGVIDITGLWDRAQNHTLGMATLASQMIESDLYQQSMRTRHHLLEQFIDMMHRYPGDSIVLLDASFRIVGTNQSARRLVEAQTGKSLAEIWDSRTFYDALLKTHQIVSNDEMSNIVMGQFSIRASVRDVRDANRRIGYLLILKPLERARSTELFVSEGCWSAVVGCSPQIKAVISKCHIAAQADVPILLLGESGTGKELFARCIHEASFRHSKPFIPINCGAIPKELLAAELFGYESGAFTGAAKSGKKGKFEEAQGGTIFLDEIGEMPFDFQVFLLRVLQECEIVRVGSARPIPVDVRVIAGPIEICKNRFKQECFVRICIIA